MAQWNIDPNHSTADFSVKHMMITTVRGTFKDVKGTINYDPANPTAATVEAIIRTESVDTRAADRDNHLRSADFFDSANFPEMTFKSTKVEMTDDSNAKITGDLTIRGTTHPVVLEAEFSGQNANPWTKAATVGFTASTKINREDWGLTWNQALETGGMLVSKEVKIMLDVEAIEVTEAITA